ncbi:hypothetical protein Tco_1134342 [Tanacetum coccineum]
MSAAANTTPIVTTVAKTANKEKTQKERDKVNIQNFCEEHYEDILPIIIDKVRRDKRKEAQTRLDFAESSETDRAGQALGIRPALEVVPLVKTVPDAEITLTTLKGGTMISIPPRGLRPSTENPLEIDIDPRTQRDGEKTNPLRLANQKAAPVTQAIGSQEKLEEDANAQQRKNIWWNWRSRRPLIDLPSHGPSRTMGNAYMVPYVQFHFNKGRKKKYVKDLVEIHNIKQKDGETIEEFMERFKVETGRMKGAPECMKISGFMHGVNNPELTKRLNEHVPKTLEEMMTATAAFVRGETAAASKKKVHTPWKPQDQSKRHNSEQRSDFRNQPRDGRGLSKFTP